MLRPKRAFPVWRLSQIRRTRLVLVQKQVRVIVSILLQDSISNPEVILGQVLNFLTHGRVWSECPPLDRFRPVRFAIGFRGRND